MQFGAQGPAPLAEFDTKDGICDCGWCEVGALLLGAPNLSSQQQHLLGTAQWHTASLTTTQASAPYDVWQENENILASACGDGSIKVWDVAAPPDVNPLRSLQEHGREVRLDWPRGGLVFRV